MSISMITRRRSAGRRQFLPLTAVTASLAIIFGSFGAIPNLSAQGRSVTDGVYTAEQAKRGEGIFNDYGRCYVCHLRNLQGDPQQEAPPLAGPVFQTIWNGKTVDDLAYTVRYTMPPGRRKGSLLVEEVSDIIAYILQQNGFPAGSRELSTDSNQLKQVMIRRSR